MPYQFHSALSASKWYSKNDEYSLAEAFVLRVKSHLYFMSNHFISFCNLITIYKSDRSKYSIFIKLRMSKLSIYIHTYEILHATLHTLTAYIKPCRLMLNRRKMKLFTIKAKYMILI